LVSNSARWRRALAEHDLITQLGLAGFGAWQRILLLKDGGGAGIFYAMRFGRIEFDVFLEVSGDVAFGVDGFDRTFSDTGSAVDAILGVDNDLVIHFVEAGNGADFNTIRKFAVNAFVGNNVSHKYFLLIRPVYNNPTRLRRYKDFGN
jgi:hypothetical protein